MLEVVVILCFIAIVMLCIVVTIRPPPAIKRTDVDGVLHELHKMSRSTGSRVHINDVEMKLRKAAR